MKKSKSPGTDSRAVPTVGHCPTGVSGLDEVLGGGLPRSRTTLVCGNAGSGKTMLGMEFLLHGSANYGEPGIFVSFEETPEELQQNFASLGFDLTELSSRKLLAIDYVEIRREAIAEAGEYNLDGLFIRLAAAIETIGARRVVLDTLEALFAGLSDQSILRAELRRLFRWLKDKGMTTLVTGERGDSGLTRLGLEEYVADCVILLDSRATDQIATRRLRILKYRGGSHGSNEYPFLLGEDGVSILPVTVLGLDHSVSDERLSSGIERLDTMLDGQGYFRGSTVLVSGTAGSGKSSMCAHFAAAACARGERCLYFAFEESAPQIMRNMRSIGLDLEQFVKKGLLRFHNARPSLYGLEMHLVNMHKRVQEFRPSVVIVDPISNISFIRSGQESKSMLTRLIDFLKSGHVTAMFSDLTHSGELESSTDGISSLIDTWICMRDVENVGERNRGLYILKSRGMAHSNQIREFRLSEHGVELLDVYLGPQQVLMGSARRVQESKDAAQELARVQEHQRRKRDYEHKRRELENRIAVLRAECADLDANMNVMNAEQGTYLNEIEKERIDLAGLRQADAARHQRSGATIGNGGVN
ncbi:MAG TPA: circadian clock protein KaiC [Pseudoduganella sp.]